MDGITYFARVRADAPHPAAGKTITHSFERVEGMQPILEWGPVHPVDYGSTDFWWDGNTQAVDERGIDLYVADGDGSSPVPADMIEIVGSDGSVTPADATPRPMQVTHPNLRRMMDLSTGHLTESTRNMMERLSCEAATDDTRALRFGCGWARNGEYGWLLWVPPEDAGPKDPPPPDLAACIAYARAYRCGWILFDRDAGPVDDLPFFDA